MKESSDNDLKAVCTITELVKKLGLSRARFYDLLKMGIFPKAARSRTGRPYYPLDLQQKCIEIRRTGVGFNGQPIPFNAARRTKPDRYEELVCTLKSLRLNVSRSEIRDAVKALYPGGLAKGPIEGTVTREVFRYFKDKL